MQISMLPTRTGWRLLMSTSLILGVIYFSFGLLMLVSAYNAIDAPILETLNATSVTRSINWAMWFLAFGAISVVGGGVAVIFGIVGERS